jgi:hypothetical protein
MALSLRRCPLQSRNLFGQWRVRAGSQVSARMKPLVTLVPAGTRGMDFHTLTGEAPTIEQGIGALLTVRRDHVLAELQDLDRVHRLPRSAWAVAETGGDARRQLADSAQATYQALVEPYWTRIQAHLAAEQAWRSRILLRQGAARLLGLSFNEVDGPPTSLFPIQRAIDSVRLPDQTSSDKDADRSADARNKCDGPPTGRFR